MFADEVKYVYELKIRACIKEDVILIYLILGFVFTIL